MTTVTHTLKMAMPTQEDVDTTIDFLVLMDFLFDSRMFRQGCEDSWEEDLDEDDDDRKYMLRVRKDIAEEEGISEKNVDNRLVLFEAIKRKYMACDCSWRRVVQGGEMVIYNACDPTAKTIEWHPYIERAMDNEMMGE